MPIFEVQSQVFEIQPQLLARANRATRPLSAELRHNGFRCGRGLVFALSLAVTLGVGAGAEAQAKPAATREPVQVGATFSFGNPDYTETYIKGFSVYGDYSLVRRISAEIEYHNLDMLTPAGVGESSFLAGPRYAFSIEDRATLYVKALGGVGRIQFQAPKPNAGTYTYAAFAPGAGIDFRASHHINVRAIDLEYQLWPGFQPHGLSPWVVSMGTAWTF